MKIKAVMLLIVILIWSAAFADSPALAKGGSDREDGGGPGRAESKLVSLEEAMRNFREAREAFLRVQSTMSADAAVEQKLLETPEKSREKAIETQESIREDDSEPAVFPQSSLKIHREQLKLLQKAAEAFIERQKKMIERIKKSEVFVENDKRNLEPVINDQLSKLENFKKEVSATTVSLSTVDTLTKKIKEESKNSRGVQVRKSVITAYLDEFESRVIATAETRAAKIEAVIKELKLAGNNVVTLEILFDEAQAHISVAKDLIAKIEAAELQPTLRSSLEQVRNHIKIAYQIFEEIAILGQSLKR